MGRTLRDSGRNPDTRPSTLRGVEGLSLDIPCGGVRGGGGVKRPDNQPDERHERGVTRGSGAIRGGGARGRVASA
jgi:hypothetical protein